MFHQKSSHWNLSSIANVLERSELLTSSLSILSYFYLFLALVIKNLSVIHDSTLDLIKISKQVLKFTI